MLSVPVKRRELKDIGAFFFLDIQTVYKDINIYAYSNYMQFIFIMWT